ncbi:MAG: chromate transporter [Candidatus Epulonipiscioides saccharophilum]|nr:MAG: chromate transporter [Epulopiscium sp. AS2M-Bin001]
MKNLLNLFLAFFKIGALTFGGGYAMMPIIQAELVNKRGWVEEEEVLDYYAIGQMTPGIIAVNTATFIGYKQGKILGAIVATLGVVAPSIVIITLIASVFDLFMQQDLVAQAFFGIRIVVVALIASGVVALSKKSLLDLTTKILFVLSILIMAIWSPSPIILILIGAVCGLIFGREVTKK